MGRVDAGFRLQCSGMRVAWCHTPWCKITDFQHHFVPIWVSQAVEDL